MKTAGKDFWADLPGLVWSNPKAGDSAYIRAALLKARFDYLLPIAIRFGLDRLHEEWNILAEEDSPEARSAACHVRRILRNIQQGFSDAAPGN